MPIPRRQLFSFPPDQHLGEAWAHRLLLALRLTPLALLLPMLTALLTSWDTPLSHQGAPQRHFASATTPPLPVLKAALPAVSPGLLGNLPPPAPHLNWPPRRYPAHLHALTPVHVRPLAFGWLGRRQLEGG